MNPIQVQLEISIPQLSTVLEIFWGINTKLDQVLKALGDVKKQEVVLSAELDALTAQVKASTDVEASAVILIQGLAAKITAAQTDPVALKALASSLNAEAATLAAAVAANTPAAA